MRQESGFTLIELIVVIVILGILASFAVPRFVGMQSEARKATVEGLQGSIKGAVSLAHAKALAGGLDSSGNIPASDVSGASQDIIMQNSTYPEASNDGIGRMIDKSGYTNGSQTFGDVSNFDTTISYHPEDIPTADYDSCGVAYGANATDYAVNATTDGC